MYQTKFLDLVDIKIFLNLVVYLRKQEQFRHYPRSPTQNGGISTETKPWNFSWNFHGEFHGFDYVEFPVEFPQEIPWFSFCGNSTIKSTVLSLWKFHGKFHRFVSGFLETGQIYGKSTQYRKFNDKRV